MRALCAPARYRFQCCRDCLRASRFRILAPRYGISCSRALPRWLTACFRSRACLAKRTAEWRVVKQRVIPETMVAARLQ